MDMATAAKPPTIKKPRAKKAVEAVTAKRLRELLSYDAGSGVRAGKLVSA